LEPYTYASRIAVVPTPVRRVPPAPRTGIPRAMYAGRLARTKGLTTLLDAWRRVVLQHPDAQLTLVGEGERRDSVEPLLHRMVREQPLLRSSVRFAGWVTNVGDYFREHDVFVLPSEAEGMSNALLEACVLARIIVASDIPENRSVLGDDYPLLFRVGDVDGLTHGLLRAFNDSAVQNLASSRARARSAAFSTDVVVDRLEPLLMACDLRPKQTGAGLRLPL
jgi:glycosyltransferase involved in cell wall biosynthesis